MKTSSFLHEISIMYVLIAKIGIMPISSREEVFISFLIDLQLTTID